MGGWIEITDRSFNNDDTRVSKGPALCTAVTSWGVLASPTKSNKDWYQLGWESDPHQTILQPSYHFFCQKVDTEGSPTVLMVKLFPDPQFNPLGFPVLAPATMTSTEHFAEWKMFTFFGKYNNSEVVLFRVPNDEIWFQSLPPPAPLLTPWRVIYNIIKYGWQP